jgi:hypothetical protein
VSIAFAPPLHGVRDRNYRPTACKEKHMTSKKLPVVRKPTKKITDSRRIRFGGGCAPAKVVRATDAATADSGAVRFGGGCAPAILSK